MLTGFGLYVVNLAIDPTFHVRTKLSLKDPLSNYKEEVHIRDVFHCDGLLLCTTTDKRLVVWNPCSGETNWIKFKASYRRLDWFALGRSSSNEYKILRVDEHAKSYTNPEAKYEIYDFTSKSWKVVGESRDWCILGVWRLGISFPERNEIILCFDYSSERFVHLSLPSEDLVDHVLALSVTTKEPKLCMLATRHFDIDVWIATKIESNGAATWSKFFTVKRAERNQFGLTLSNGMSFLADLEKKVLVCPICEGVISKSFLHILGEDEHIAVNHDDDAGTQCSLVLSYFPSLIRIQQVF